MATKEVSLAVAAFLDGPEARALPAEAGAHLRPLAELVLEAVYEDLAKKPRLLDGDDLAQLLDEALPARLAPKDPRARHVPALLAALLAHLEATELVPHAFEARRALEEHAEAFLRHVASGANAARQLDRRTDPFVHRAAKLGRNDPCSCGSGKKFKKCHGKEG